MKRTTRSPKSRGGCQTCKAKHVKCDEAKPACRVCATSGLECAGYARKIRWTSKHEVYPANFYPHMAPLGLAKRSQAWLALQQDLQQILEGGGISEQVLMSLLLLGPSSCWHQASSLGLQYPYVARGFMHSRLKDGRPEGSTDSSVNKEFFLEALLYWEMLASFVDPIPLSPFGGLKEPDLLSLHTEMEAPRFPHAWAGVGSDPIFLLAQGGRVLRRQRHIMSAWSLDPKKRNHFRLQDEQWAGSLERGLLDTHSPAPDEIVEYDDPKTPKLDLAEVARACKSIALLEIYSEFPALHQRQTSETVSSVTPEQGVESLASVALEVLNMVKPISLSSGVCRMLPLLLMSAAIQLSLDDAQRRDEAIQARYVVEE